MGYGKSYTLDELYHMGSSHAHNMMLNLLYISGIVGIIMFFIFLLYIDKNTVMLHGTREYIILTICLFAFFVTCLTEPFEEMQAVPVMFALLNYLPQFKNQNNVKVINGGKTNNEYFVCNRC